MWCSQEPITQAWTTATQYCQKLDDKSIKIVSFEYHFMSLLDYLGLIHSRWILYQNPVVHLRYFLWTCLVDLRPGWLWLFWGIVSNPWLSNVKISLRETPNPNLLPVPCMAATALWYMNVSINGWMSTSVKRFEHCDGALKVQYNCTPISQINSCEGVIFIVSFIIWSQALTSKL